jgi:hypothetical protein
MSIPSTQRIVVDNAGGWQTERRTGTVSGLQSFEAQLAARDETMPFALIGLRDQLEPLAKYLERTTRLGLRQTGMWPSLTGVEAILARYLNPFAMRYMTLLKRLNKAEPRLVERLIVELDDLCDSKRISRADQLAIVGVKPARQLNHRGVSIRPLSPVERGVVLEDRNNVPAQQHLETDFIPPHRFEILLPSALIQISTTRLSTENPSLSTLPNRIALALFLSGYEFSSSGILLSFDQPRWVSAGFSQSPFPASEKAGIVDQRITQKKFEAVIDLAHRIPIFSGTEGNAREIALFRVLRGCGMHWQESGFLDFAIALEAALLGKSTTELSYKFSLYGALFLSEERDPEETFEALRLVYKLRSDLVHGGRIRVEDLNIATQKAGEIAKAVVRRAIKTGWPKQAELDELALARGFKKRTQTKRATRN